MWILFGNKTRVRPVAGGQTVERHCAECKQVRKFVECEVADKVSVFFVPLFDMKNRRMVCPECGDDHEVSSTANPRERKSPSPPPAASPSTRHRPSDGDLEKMLADLKKKLGQ
jgi:uncharacterized Zn finger protein (UPF0148 family)